MATPDCCETLDWLKAGLPVVVVIVSVTTWWVTQRRTKQSERRKEAKSAIEAFSNQIDTIHQRAYQYHCGPEAGSDLATEIHVLLRILGDNLIRFDPLEQCDASRLLMRLRQAITLRNFETRQFECKSHRDPLLKAIDSACSDTKAALNFAFSKLYD